MTQAAVGTFFIIAGYLFFKNIGNFDLTSYCDKLKRRVQTLVIPYIVWNVLAILVFIFFHLFKHQSFDSIDLIKGFWCNSEWDTNQHNILGFVTPMYGPMDLPLWYLRDLIIQVILSPLTYWVVKHFKIGYIVLLAACFITKIWIWIPGFSINAFLFFALGTYLALNRKEFGVCIRNRYLKYSLLTVSFFLLTYISVLSANNVAVSYIIRQTGVLAGIFTFGVLGELTSRRVSDDAVSKIERLNQSVFFVYAVHAFCSVGFTQIVGHFLYPVMEKSNLYVFMICYLTAPFIIYSLSVFVYYIFRRYNSSLANLLNGQR